MVCSFPIARCILFALAGWLVLAGPVSVCAQSVWELTPYRVRVVISAANVPELQGVPRRLTERLLPRLENLLGAAWQIDVTPAGDLGVGVPYIMSERQRETNGAPALAALAAEHDKVVLLRVDRAVDGWRVAAREWDAATWRLGPVVGYPIRQRAKMCDTAVRALLTAFRPLGRLERVEAGRDGQVAILRLRAGGLPTRDPELALVRAGQLFCPIVRLSDREGGLRRDREGNRILPQPVPWTFLRADSVKGSEVSCRVASGLGSPLSASRRGRMEQLALGVIPRPEATRLTLLSRREPHHPMAGYEVFIQESGEKATRSIGRTGRTGSIALPASDAPMTIALVRSGQQLLARLPVVSGFAAQLTAYVPDDNQRLEAEAYVTALQEQLVDTVTRRQVLLARAEVQLDAGRAAVARQLLVELEQLPDRATLHRRLFTRQSQLRSADAHVQGQIETLFADTFKLLDRHLDPAPIEALARALSRQPEAGEPEQNVPESDP